METKKGRTTKNETGQGKETCWEYQKECLETPPEGFYGFTYLITVLNNPSVPKEYRGYIYIGKKAFTFVTKKKVTKKEIKETKTRKRVIRGTKESDWMGYYGSSITLKNLVKELGQQNFKREILSFATNKTDLALQEVENICKYKVLRIKNSFNMWMSSRIYKKYLL